ncbi:MAG: protein-glutamate O-methyltransferase [Bacteroidales bacterium]|nr:protein-glutamate O-methyltransferase [Bacteroidales bacterium]
MVDPLLNDIYKAELTLDDFNRLSSFIYHESGIKMPPIKRVMLQSRLQKRLKELRISSFKDYCNYVFSNEGSNNEIIHMLDVVSTNKTDFFREPAHFDFFTSTILPEYISNVKFNKIIKIWSAGCSSGEEPYTIAIVIYEFLEKNPSFDFYILGTDISTNILQKAANAIYKEDRVACIPYSLKQKYLLRSKERTNPTVKISNQLRSKIHFERLNFMDDYYNLKDKFDVVFCRNVLIYFDRETQEKVINKICLKINEGGYFFLGHSESILNMKVPLKQIKPTIFQKI